LIPVCALVQHLSQKYFQQASERQKYLPN
jgi:hypothetical protein